MRVFSLATGQEIKPGDRLTLPAKPWQDPEEFVFGAPGASSTGSRDKGIIRLTDSNGDNTYRPAAQFGLMVTPNDEAYVAEVSDGKVIVSIFGRGLTAKDADKIARKLLPGVKLAGSSNSLQTTRRIYARQS